MKRDVYDDILSWFSDSKRKPLIIRGARQVGKSYLVRDFAKQQKIPLIELNFERDPKLKELFQSNDPKTIVRNIETYKNVTMLKALLFLDEIQAAPEILAKLRWFHEELPSLPIIAAGSLLDFTLADHSFSMPVGRITFLHLEPMSFSEFLLAQEEKSLHDFLKESSFQDKVPQVIHERLLELFRQYILVGGMPEAVEAYRKEHSYLTCSQVHSELLATLRDDFAKYASHAHHDRLAKVLQAVPAFLGRKFVLSKVDRNERSDPLKKALELLCLARVCHKVRATDATGLPLGATADDRSYKTIFLDVGLACASLGLSIIDLANDIELVNSGAIAEQVAGQLLRVAFPKYKEPELFYWMREQTGSEAEVDYIVQQQSRVLPIEIKAGTSGSLKSLHILMAERKLKQAVRFNSDMPSVTKVDLEIHNGKKAKYELISLPIYWVEQLPRLLTS